MPPPETGSETIHDTAMLLGMLATMPTLAGVLIYEISDGDVRKIQARSQNATTGGGARDFRIPTNRVGDHIAVLFPDVQMETRRRRQGDDLDAPSATTEVPVRSAKVRWFDPDGTEQEERIIYEPPTASRPAEGRITLVHKLGAFALSRLPHEEEGRRFLLLVRDENGLYAHFASERSIRSDNWHARIKSAVLSHIAATHTPLRDYIDFSA